MNSIVGVVEGFYGRPWSQDQRLHLINKMMPDFGMNSYFYAPKDDQKHRQLWRELYAGDEIAALQGLIQGCHAQKLQFWYGIAPGLDFSWTDDYDGDLQRLLQKADQLQSLGCSQFILLFDDIDIDASSSDTMADVARLQARLTNALFDHLATKAPAPSLLMCPTFYCEAFCPLGLASVLILAPLGMIFILPSVCCGLVLISFLL